MDYNGGGCRQTVPDEMGRHVEFVCCNGVPFPPTPDGPMQETTSLLWSQKISVNIELALEDRACGVFRV